MKNIHITIILVVLICLINPLVFAQKSKTIIPEDILSMSLDEMLNVKITTAGKKDERIADIPASAIVITRSDIETYGYMSLEDILKNVSGMYVIDDYAGYRKNYGIRGFFSGYPRNIIFLVNGVSQVEGVFDFNVMSNFNIPVEAIDRIEVVRGPMSVMYGQGAFFGAINIITNDAYDETCLAAVSYGNMTRKAAARLTGTQGEFAFSLSAGVSDTVGPDYDLHDMVSDMSVLDFWGIDETNNTTENRLERDSRNIIFSGKYKNFYTDMMINQSTDEAYVFRPSVTGGSAYQRDSVKVAIGYADKISENVRIDANITYHHFEFTLDWDVVSAVFEGNDAGESSGEADMYEVEVNAFVDVGENMELTSGLYYKMLHDTAFHADLNLFQLFFDYTTADTVSLWAGFTQIKYQLNEKLKLVGGVRVEQLCEYATVYDNKPVLAERKYDEDDLDFVSSLAAIYSFNAHNLVKLLYGSAVARPSFFQNSEQLRGSYPALVSERIQTVELNYTAVPTSKMTLNVSLFHNVLDNLIVRNTALPVQYSINGGKLVTNGAEISLRSHPFDRFSADLSLTYQKTEDQRNGYDNIDVGYSPRLLGYAKLAYNITDDITVALTGTYVDEIKTEWDGTLNSGAGGRIGKSVDDFFLVDMNLRINNLFGKGYYLNLHGANILNKKYLYPAYVNNTWADKGTLGDPFEVLVTVGLKF